jgi:predicted amidohydrolase
MKGKTVGLRPGTALVPVAKTPGKTGSLRVAAVQMRFAQTTAENLHRIGQATAAAAKDGVDVILFPECATTGYACDFGTLDSAPLGDAIRSLGSMAALHRVQMLVGSPVFCGRNLFNGLLVFDRQGRLVHTYAKCQLTESDRRWFTPGDGLSLFRLDGVPSTAILCHERRYPELVRIPVMAGAKIVFHPNAGMDRLEVSKTKRGGRDGIPVRAFENAVFYVFANSVGPQGGGLWSAGDSKIVAPDGTLLRLADNRRETMLVADLDLARATRKYAQDSLRHPRFLAPHWRRILSEMRRRVRENNQTFRRGMRGGVKR